MCIRGIGSPLGLKGLVPKRGVRPKLLSSDLSISFSKVSFQMNGPQGVGGVSDTNISQMYDVRSVGAMLCEVMHGKSDSVKAASRQYELALDKLKNLQEVSDFLLQEKSDPISKASQQTKLLCQLVLGMLRSDAKQISAEAAARHEFFSVVIDSTSLDDQVAGSWQQPGA